MKYNSSYLVCHDNIKEVREFLSDFLPERRDKYNHEGWITFEFPGTDYIVSLMKGKDQKMTQNMTFEISCEGLDELKEQARKFNKEVGSFVATETDNPYRYHYIEILGPSNICKIEINYSEELK